MTRRGHGLFASPWWRRRPRVESWRSRRQYHYRADDESCVSVIVGGGSRLCKVAWAPGAGRNNNGNNNKGVSGEASWRGRGGHALAGLSRRVAAAAAAVITSPHFRPLIGAPGLRNGPRRRPARSSVAARRYLYACLRCSALGADYSRRRRGRPLITRSLAVRMATATGSELGRGHRVMIHYLDSLCWARWRGRRRTKNNNECGVVRVVHGVVRSAARSQFARRAHKPNIGRVS